MDGIDRIDPVTDHIASSSNDSYIPGGWLEPEPISPTRKRKATFDLPAAKRLSPERSPYSTSLWQKLDFLSPLRLARKFWIPQITRKDEHATSQLSNVATTNHPATEETTQSSCDQHLTEESLDTDRVASQHLLNRQSPLVRAVPLPISPIRNLRLRRTIHHLARSSSSSMEGSRLLEQNSPDARGLPTSYAEWRRARQVAFARAAHLQVRQPQHGEEKLLQSDGTMEDQKFDNTSNIDAPRKRLGGAQMRRFTVDEQRKPKLAAQLDMIPTQVNVRRSISDPPSPSVQLFHELEASIAPPNPDVDVKPGLVHESWTMPRKSFRKTPKKPTPVGEAHLQRANEQNDSLHETADQPRRFSPPAMGRRLRPVISAKVAEGSSAPVTPLKNPLKAVAKAQAVDSEQLASPNPTPGSFPAEPFQEECHANHTPDMNMEITLHQDMMVNGSATPHPHKLEVIETPKSSEEPLLDVAQLSIQDDFVTAVVTPKATGHSGERLKRLTRAQLRKKQLEEEALNQFEIVPLSAAWDAKVRLAVRQGHGSYASSDLARAVPEYAGRGQDNWLNDEVINGYLSLVTAHGKKNDRPNQTPSFHAFNSFFYSNLSTKGPDSVMRWSKRPKINGSNLLNVEAVFIPINTGVHWTLAVVEPKKKTITHYNSMRSSALGVTACGHIQKWVAKELGRDFIEEEWSLVAVGESPQQTNSDDCGVFTITSARQIMLGFKPMSYRSDQMRVQRKRIVAELINNGLLRSKETEE